MLQRHFKGADLVEEKILQRFDVFRVVARVGVPLKVLQI